ncbi:linear amide C-N hydrolase [Vagococcus coleopterorum]|uniref:Linear amide C-N hydrolase n=1 Tax=Vagococcus coleopterorum TaxID=2714946 RepID=A0A6G8AMN1_9ENTE|nr:linear amide C-N hydrolase [Vagococcus coleopterorum]QIL46219.1 linear amide C-N hydrolase [Vagococcus coleopterorum]
MCTSIRIISEEGKVVFGRTQEYMLPLPYVAANVPAGTVLTNTMNPIEFKHQAIGVCYDGEPFGVEGVLFADGMNSAGIGASMQYFSDFCVYGKEEAILAEGKTPYRGEEFVTWVLATVSSLDELIEKLTNDIDLCDKLNNLGKCDPLHFNITDSKGRSVVIEHTSETKGFDIHENKVGTMTNHPTYDWHVTNLSNYAGMEQKLVKAAILGEAIIPAAGKGSGMHGLPGDFTSQSRFVRATYLNNLSKVVPHEQGINKFFHIMNQFDIPDGVFDLEDGTNFDYNTQYTSAYDLENKVMYVSMNGNRQLQGIKMTAVDKLTKYALKQVQTVDFID